MIYINGAAWRVEYVKNGNEALRRSDGTQTIGSTDFNTRTIYLSESLTGGLLDRVITHELCHAELFERGIKDFSLRQEEVLCEFVSLFGREIFQLADMIIEMRFASELKA